MKTSGCVYGDSSPAFSYSDLALGHGLYSFLLEPDHADETCMNIRKKVIVEISVSFDSATTAALSLIVFSTQDAIVEIDSRRNVFSS